MCSICANLLRDFVLAIDRQVLELAKELAINISMEA
jgi:hypothetical protein